MGLAGQGGAWASHGTARRWLSCVSPGEAVRGRGDSVNRGPVDGVTKDVCRGRGVFRKGNVGRSKVTRWQSASMPRPASARPSKVTRGHSVAYRGAAAQRQCLAAQCRVTAKQRSATQRQGQERRCSVGVGKVLLGVTQRQQGKVQCGRGNQLRFRAAAGSSRAR
jgi:hypothetical protein